ncbi:PREDICTED: putative gustatory receptor 28b [Vollenhovia emeryi]|uniref:putative gustatory receptor 28b n=1 Tax=Vollenhovia emeryi TaxID=411798 RepID=UPI0005F52B69|nr:PREDICTED: putative gustatory receptor 28b [Vollenhovia emeryi]
MQRQAKDKMWKRWGLFQATDFQSLMYPCFTFCRILGIFPYKLKASTFEASKPCYILSIVISCIYCVFDVILIHGIIASKMDFGSVTKKLQVTIYYVSSDFLVIITHVLNSARMRLSQTMLEISAILPPDSYQELSRFIHTKDILAIILRIINIYLNFYKLLTYQLNFTETPLSLNIILVITIFTVYAALLELQINMLYINYICVLKACFKRINDNLAHIQKLMINDMKQCNLGLISRVHRNQVLLVELQTLRKQHLMISNTVQMLNIVFSLPLLASIILCFCVTIFDLYFNAVHWNMQDGIFISLDRYLLDRLLTAMMYNCVKIVLLAWACETTKNQAEGIVTTIHDLLNSTDNKQIKKELQLFSLQTLHCKNIFSPKGFTVDSTLLATTVGTIAMYLLILLQFLNMSHSCDEKAAISVTQPN